MNLEIKKYSSLPCGLEIFKINGVDAWHEDFGVLAMNNGSCMENECGCEFIPKLPIEEILKKYGITLDEYSKIATELKDKLYVYGCGWCS